MSSPPLLSSELLVEKLSGSPSLENSSLSETSSCCLRRAFSPVIISWFTYCVCGCCCCCCSLPALLSLRRDRLELLLRWLRTLLALFTTTSSSSSSTAATEHPATHPPNNIPNPVENSGTKNSNIDNNNKSNDMNGSSSATNNGNSEKQEVPTTRSPLAHTPHPPNGSKWSFQRSARETPAVAERKDKYQQQKLNSTSTRQSSNTASPTKNFLLSDSRVSTPSPPPTSSNRRHRSIRRSTRRSPSHGRGSVKRNGEQADRNNKQHTPHPPSKPPSRPSSRASSQASSRSSSRASTLTSQCDPTPSPKAHGIEQIKEQLRQHQSPIHRAKTKTPSPPQQTSVPRPRTFSNRQRNSSFGETVQLPLKRPPIRMASCSIAGSYGGCVKENQDSTFQVNGTVGAHENGFEFLVGVLDGHGVNGHKASRFLKRDLQKRLVEELQQAARLLFSDIADEGEASSASDDDDTVDDVFGNDDDEEESVDGVGNEDSGFVKGDDDDHSNNISENQKQGEQGASHESISSILHPNDLETHSPTPPQVLHHLQRGTQKSPQPQPMFPRPSVNSPHKGNDGVLEKAASRDAALTGRRGGKLRRRSSFNGMDAAVARKRLQTCKRSFSSSSVTGADEHHQRHHSIPGPLLERCILESARALSNCPFDVRESGSTCISCVLQGRTLYVANVGDSRCVLGHRRNGHFHAVALSRDHKPDDRFEMQRIQRAGGRVEPTRVLGIGFQGPPRVWKTPQRIGGLAIARSIGDTALACVGVVPQADIVVKELTDNDEVVVLGSDGVFDFLSNHEVVRIACRYDNVQQSANAVVKEARRKWMERGGGYIDDVSCVVVKL
eukprot:m.212909 g.212909  ORF g.212909 m.212909 type:complete len:837 (-) comp13788_c0_seq1:262-2772(-)